MNSGVHEKSYYKFIAVSSKVEETVKQALKPYGLTHAQLNVLHLLSKMFPGTMSAKEIKEALIIGQPDITRLIDRLVEKGWVTRKVCSQDRRQVDIGLTTSGFKVFKSAHEKCKESLGSFFGYFIDEEEARQLYKILKKIEL